MLLVLVRIWARIVTEFMSEETWSGLFFAMGVNRQPSSASGSYTPMLHVSIRFCRCLDSSFHLEKSDPSLSSLNI